MRSSITARGLLMDLGMSRTDLLRTVLRSLNGTLKTLTQLERDPPIIELAHIQMQNGFMDSNLGSMEKELFGLLSMINLYRSKYWQLERSIKQSFLKILKDKKFLPSYSLEVDSLKNALPDAVIKDDERIWIYSFDHYIVPISSRVGRKPKDAPTGMEIFKVISKAHSKQSLEIEGIANELLPEIHLMKAKVQSMIKDPNKEWKELHIKRPKVALVKRPIRKIIVVKRPLPLPKKGRIPKKRILKKPDFQVIGPEDRS
jgi:hypothetical protein